MIKKISISLIVLLVVALVVLLVLSPGDDQPELQKVQEPTTSRLTSEGEYVGFLDVGGARAWLGIPYAAPPIGELRWKSPQAAVGFEGIQTAIDFGDPCVQLPNPMVRGGTEATSGVVGNEDCLYLNIWSPPNSIDLPVMVWIHGGGNSTGEAATYNGANLAVKNHVVVVTVNYRLGLMGWFNHPAVLAVNEEASGNFGVLDLVHALKWVQQNIRVFGGDAQNVTVFGESAGGQNTFALLTTPKSKGLFHRAIVQSGSFGLATPLEGSAFSDDGGHSHSASHVALNLIEIQDSNLSKQQAIDSLIAKSDEEIHSLLMSSSPASLYTTFADPGFGGMIDFPGNYGDDIVLPSGSAEKVFSNLANFHQVPVMMGTNRDEPTIFMFQSPRFTENFLWVFPRLKDEEDYRRIVHYLSLEWRIRGVDSIAAAMTSAGHEHVYAYRFDWDEEPSVGGFDLATALGAGHLLEVPFVFGDFQSLQVLSRVYPMDEAQLTLSDQMMAYWTEFARNGEPGQGGNSALPQWTRYGENEQTSIIFDTDSDGGIQMSAEVASYESIRQQLISDDFNDTDLFCATYATVLRDTPHFNASEYETKGCSHIPKEEASWWN